MDKLVARSVIQSEVNLQDRGSSSCGCAADELSHTDVPFNNVI